MRYIGALRCGVVTTSDRLVVSVVVKRTVSGSAVRRSNSGAGHVGVVAGAVITGAGSEGSVAGGGGGSGDSSDLRVAELVVALLALPELVARALSVAVGGSRAEALLLLVVTTKEDLDGNRDEEQEGSNDSNSEASSVEPTSGAKGRRVGNLVALTIAPETLPGVAGAVADRGVYVASAARSTITGEDSNSDHGSAAKNVEDQAKEREEGLAAEAAGEDDCGDGVKNNCAGHALYGLLPAGNGDIAVSLDGEEVGVDSKNDCSTAELKSIKCCCDELQRSAAESHCDGLGVDQKWRWMIRYKVWVLKVERGG